MLRVPCEPPLMHRQLYDVDSSPSNGGEAADAVSAAPMPKLNQVWEFLGILSVAPNLTAHKASAGAGTGADVDGVAASFASFGFGALTEPEEELGRNPPSSLVPRLHCLCTLVVLLLHGPRVLTRGLALALHTQCAGRCASLRQRWKSPPAAPSSGYRLRDHGSRSHVLPPPRLLAYQRCGPRLLRTSPVNWAATRC